MRGPHEADSQGEGKGFEVMRPRAFASSEGCGSVDDVTSDRSGVNRDTVQRNSRLALARQKGRRRVVFRSSKGERSNQDSAPSSRNISDAWLPSPEVRRCDSFTAEVYLCCMRKLPNPVPSARGIRVPGDRKSKGIDQEVSVGPASPLEASPAAVSWRVADTNPRGPRKDQRGRNGRVACS